MKEMTKAQASAFTRNFVLAIVGIVIAVQLIPTLLYAVGNVTGVALLSASLVGTIVGAGIVLFIVEAFM
ncbi:MAG: hypothetical protein DRN81_02070 [Thermoproteota archaeon]|nr:MAG: hypothetical protein DRN81_02070 [Candidatus Korarchaeota archaeon]